MSIGKERIAYVVLVVISIGLSIFAILYSSQRINEYQTQSCRILSIRIQESVPKPTDGNKQALLRYERQLAYIKMYQSFKCNKENQNG